MMINEAWSAGELMNRAVADADAAHKLGKTKTKFIDDELELSQ
jgi:DNA-binding Xre family transcriptional regulator